jgi:hypothetical protein
MHRLVNVSKSIQEGKRSEMMNSNSQDLGIRLQSCSQYSSITAPEDSKLELVERSVQPILKNDKNKYTNLHRAEFKVHDSLTSNNTTKFSIVLSEDEDLEKKGSIQSLHPETEPNSSILSLSQPNYQILHDYLTKHSTTLQDELDDDEIALRISRMDQSAKQQTAFMIQPDVDSEDEETRIVQADAYQNHLDIIIIQEFFKQLNQFASQNEIKAKKTLNWLKKRMGLQRNQELKYIVPLWGNKSYEGSCESEDYDEDETFHIRKKRRMTRNMARDTRIKKREERQSAREGWGLQVLRAAAEDFQLDSKPYPMEKNTINVKSKNHNSGSKRSQFITSNDHGKLTSLNTLVGKVRASKWYRKRDKRIPDHFTDIKVSSITVGNKIFDYDMKDVAMVRFCRLKIFISLLVVTNADWHVESTINYSSVKVNHLTFPEKIMTCKVIPTKSFPMSKGTTGRRASLRQALPLT